MPYIENMYGGYAICDGCDDKIPSGQTKAVVFPKDLEEGQSVPATDCEHYHPRCFKTRARMLETMNKS